MKDGVIAHGMLITGFVGQAITAWVPRKCLKRFGVRFSGMTRPGNTITVTGKVVDKKNQGNIVTCEVMAWTRRVTSRSPGSSRRSCRPGDEKLNPPDPS